MFPVISLLRRASSNIIYIREEDLRKDDVGRYVLGSERSIAHLDLSKHDWSRKLSHIPLNVVEIRGPSQVSVAKRLAKWENDLVEKAGIKDVLYTLLLGPESEEVVKGTWVRRMRFGAVRGVHRAVSEEIQRVPTSNLRAAYFGGKRKRKTRKGVIRDL